VEVEVEGNTYKMELSGGEWKSPKPGQPAPETVDMRKLSALFEILHVIQYERDITGLGDKVIARETGPSLSMRVLGKDNRELLNFSIGRSLGKTILITVSGKRIFEVESLHGCKERRTVTHISVRQATPQAVRLVGYSLQLNNWVSGAVL
jgi:hypothetical protein